MKVIFAWYDIWIGVYWDRLNRYLYIFPIPMIGLRVSFRPWKKGVPKLENPPPPPSLWPEGEEWRDALKDESTRVTDMENPNWMDQWANEKTFGPTPPQFPRDKKDYKDKDPLGVLLIIIGTIMLLACILLAIYMIHKCKNCT